MLKVNPFFSCLDVCWFVDIGTCKPNYKNTNLYVFAFHFLGHAGIGKGITEMKMPMIVMLSQDISDLETEPPQHQELGPRVGLQVALQVLGDGEPEETAASEGQPPKEIPALEWGGRYLLSHYTLRIGRSLEVGGCSRTTARVRVQGAAEYITQLQHEALGSVLKAVQKMIQAGAWVPLLHVEHCLYDETPLQVMLAFDTSPTSDSQIAKVFAVEHSWSMLLKDVVSNPSEHSFFCLRGRNSPCVRGAGAATGEAILKVLQACQPSATEQLTDIFPKMVRLVEVDECPANSRAETLLLRERPSQWSCLYSFCIPHKAHAIATRTFSFFAGTIRGLTRTGMHLRTAGSLTELKLAISKLVHERLQILVHDPCDAAAVSFKEQIKQFMPSTHHPRRRATMMAICVFFNGNWLRSDTLHHVCQGCCRDRDASVVIASKLLHKMVSCLFRGVFCRADWKNWAQTTHFYIWADALHSLVVDAFRMAFGREGAEIPREQGASHPTTNPDAIMDLLDDPVVLGAGSDAGPHPLPQDANAQLRAENAISVAVALRFMVRGLWRDVYMFNTVLRPQCTLMAGLLHSTSRKWELTQLQAAITSHSKQTRILNLHEGSLLNPFFEENFSLLVSESHWEHLAETEAFRTQLFQALSRSSSVAHQLIALRMAGFPYRMFTLIRDGADNALASDILAVSPCLLDAWSRSFLQAHNTAEQLTGQQAKWELHILAEEFLGTTYTTERLHSKNLRRARDKQLRRPDIHYLGLSHMGWSAPTSCPKNNKAAEAQPANPQGGRPRKKKDADEQVGGADRATARSKGGGGGAWRAFLHQQHLPFKGRQVQVLAAAYAALSDEEKAWYREIGQQGAL